MSASVVEVAPPEVVRAWRDRIVSLVVSGTGVSSDLAPRFPGELPGDLPIRFASLRFDQECCTLTVYIQVDDPAALVLRLGSEPKLEIEVDDSSVRVAWCLPVAEMTGDQANEPKPRCRSA